MQIREIMTSSVETIAAYASLKEAARKMESEDVGFLPVLEDGELVGVITDRDITVRAVSRGLDPEQTTVEDTMTSDIVTLPENSELEDASDLMEDRNIRRLVVTDENDRPVGVISKDKLALYLGVYAMDNGLVRDMREFRPDFDPPAQAGESEEAGATVPPENSSDVQRPARRARDQGDPR
jgi:CBS domain-containing protein